jgi:catechol 2,3-dioxygenase-like lactoylglutathione lyase family enzyme
MNVTNLDAVTYGVFDLGEAKRFWTDFGLVLVEENRDRLLFCTQEHTTVEVLHASDPALPPPIEEGPAVRESTFGVTSSDDLKAIALELSRDREVRTDPDGTIHSIDPFGLGIAFRVSRRQKVTAPQLQFNVPGRVGRLNARGKMYASAAPLEMGHVAFMVPDAEVQRKFYADRLQFRISDGYPGRGYFLRGGASTNHHNFFALNPGGKGTKLGFHHVAFEIGSIHELFGGGLNMTRKGWKTMLGPGRHPISSCYFWYFLNPCGGGAEYDFDSDVVDQNWVAGEFQQTPAAFAEWCLAAGMEESLLYRGVQTGDTIKRAQS